MKNFFALLAVAAASPAFAQTTHIVAAGVDVNLNGERNDPWGAAAKRVAEAIAAHSRTQVKKHVFSGPKATKRNVLRTLSRLNASPYDTTVIIISTHGVNDDRGFSLELFGERMPAAELAEAIGKLPCRVILIVDACGAGAMLDTPTPRALVICACTRYENSFGSLFTNALVKGIGGAADLNKDGRVSFRELSEFLPRECVITSKGKQTVVSR